MYSRHPHGRTSAARALASRIAGFSTSLSLNPVQKILWRIESISMCGGSVSGLRWSRRLSREAANPKMNAASANAV